MVKKYNPKQDKGAVIFALIVVAIIFCIGAYMVFVVYPQQVLEKEQLSTVPVVNKEQLRSTEGRRGVMITGHLIDNAVIKDKDFVAFQTYRWEVKFNNGDYEGKWWRDSERWPALLVAIDGGRAHTIENEPSLFNGALHEVVEARGGGKAAKYNGQALPNGSLRTVGVKNGDQVTIAGKTTHDATIIPEYFYVGTRQKLLESLMFNAKAIRVIGFILMAITGLISLLIVFKRKT